MESSQLSINYHSLRLDSMTKIPERIPGLIQVLWVEDNPNVTESYPVEAENYDIQLVSFPCWDDAKAALQSQFKRWEAIILDAKCKVHINSMDDAVYFLGNALVSITDICWKEGRKIPWYVLSGGSEEEVSKSIPETRQEWDGDWHKAYYEKSIDRSRLFERIRDRVRRAPAMFIQERFSDVFEAIEWAQIGHDTYSMMEELLLEVFYPSNTNSSPNSKFKNVRQIIEAIFRSMMDNGILPRQERPVPEWLCRLLRGGDVKVRKDKNEILVAHMKKTIAPIIVCDNIKQMRHVTGAYLHTESGSERNTKNTISYLKDVGETTYLLQSYALQLCDIILWYANYLEKNPDVEVNSFWWCVDDEDLFNNRVKTAESDSQEGNKKLE